MRTGRGLNHLRASWCSSSCSSSSSFLWMEIQWAWYVHAVQQHLNQEVNASKVNIAQTSRWGRFQEINDVIWRRCFLSTTIFRNHGPKIGPNHRGFAKLANPLHSTTTGRPCFCSCVGCLCCSTSTGIWLWFNEHSIIEQHCLPI